MLYFISDGSGLVKIGHVTDSRYLPRRIEMLQTGNGRRLTLIATAPGDVYAEKQLHDMFQHLRTVGEWFTAEGALLDYIGNLDGAGPPTPPMHTLTRRDKRSGNRV